MRYPENLYSIKGAQFKAVELPNIKEITSKEYVLFGDRNNYPNKVIELYDTSAIHATAINAIRDAVYGEGIKTFGSEYVNQKGEDINDIYEKITLDYILFGGYALNVIWNKEGSRISEIYHLPFANVRSGKKDEDHEIVEYYYSADWTNLRKNPFKAHRAFDVSDNKKDNASQIFYYKTYQPGQDYYPLPEWVAASTDVDLDARISRFHNSSIQNGVSPNLFIKFRNGIPTEDERASIYNSIEQTFSGEQNSGRFWLSFSEPGKEMEVEPIENANDTYFIQVEERLVSRILTAHRISSPLLLGIKTASGFSNNADEIKVAFEHFTSTVVKPKQKKILGSFNYILKFFGMTVNLEVEPQQIIVETVTAEEETTNNIEE